MWWDFLLFVTVGPLIGLVIYYLTDHKNRPDDHLNQLREHSHLAR